MSDLAVIFQVRFGQDPWKQSVYLQQFPCCFVLRFPVCARLLGSLVRGFLAHFERGKVLLDQENYV